jgi:hypothetical protein
MTIKPQNGENNTPLCSIRRQSSGYETLADLHMQWQDAAISSTPHSCSSLHTQAPNRQNLPAKTRKLKPKAKRKGPADPWISDNSAISIRAMWRMNPEQKLFGEEKDRHKKLPKKIRSLRIQSAKKHHQNGNTGRKKKGTFVVYSVFVQLDNGHSFVVHRRYNQFFAFHNQLRRKYPTKVLPSLPPKVLIGNSSRRTVTKRLQYLRMYLLLLLSTHNIRGDQVLLSFLGVKTTQRQVSEEDEMSEFSWFTRTGQATPPMIKYIQNGSPGTPKTMSNSPKPTPTQTPTARCQRFWG